MLSRFLSVLFLALLLLVHPSCTPAQPNTLNGRAVKIIDGDTFDLLTSDNITYRIRLHGIDCPERGQDFYKVCKTALGDLCAGQQVSVIVRDKDRYQRTVGDVFTAQKKWVNLEMVAGGFAWHFTRYDQDHRLEDAMQEARRQKAGLWIQPAPIAPWEWRKAKRTPAHQ